MSKRHPPQVSAPRHVAVTTHGPPLTDGELRTASGRVVRDGDTVTAADPIVLAARDDTSATMKIGIAGREHATPPAAPTWNNIRRAWMIPGPDGEPVLANPQPPPPSGIMQTEWGPMPYVTKAIPLDVAPAVKITT